MTEQNAAPTDDDRHPPSRQEILRDIQGGVIGFNKDHLRLIYLNLADSESGRQFIAELLPAVANGFEVLSFNAIFGEIAKRGGDPDSTIQARWINVLLAKSGLEVLGAQGMESMPEEFLATMGQRSALLGDVEGSAHGKWVAPFTGGVEPHVVVMVGADTAEGAEERRTWVESVAAKFGVSVIAGAQVGETRPAPFAGHEHFGFKDGIAQPGIGNLTKSSKSGTIPAGEVLIGYEDADGHVSGQPSPTPTPPPSPYDPAPAQVPTQPLPGWMHNGSFVVYRRLRQDVASFKASMEANAPNMGLTPDQIAAKLVGRWPSGAPMEHVPGEPKKLDPSVEDPSVAHPDALSKAKIDKFDFADDPDGMRVPRAAHIRKMNPRADVLADGDNSARHRMVRRGITYGPEFAPGETPYGDVVPDNQDRGLLFINYQASIARTFEFVQTRWANREDFQKPGDGKDPIISQDTQTRSFNLPPHGQLNFERWVFTTGGAYLVSPSLTGLAQLCGIELQADAG